MKKGIAATFALALAGCSAALTPVATHQPAAHGTDVPRDPSWRLTYQSTCVDGTAEGCLGYYGFSIKNDGTYQLGPGPDQELVTGKLDPDEFRQFQQYLSTLYFADFEINAFAPDLCVQAEVGPVTTVQLGYLQLSHSILRVAGADLCFDGTFVPSARKANEIETWLEGLTKKYYRTPFPG